jgi:hypothetical protein
MAKGKDEVKELEQALSALATRRTAALGQLDELKSAAQELRSRDVRRGVSVDELAELNRRVAELHAVVLAADELTVSARASLDQAKAKANEAAIQQLRESEHAAFEDIRAAATALHECICKAEAIWTRERELGGIPYCAVPKVLFDLTAPVGPHSARGTWDHGPHGSKW